MISSRKEKDGAYEQYGHIERWLFVEELQRLLEHLKPNDWLVPNRVANLAIYRSINGEDVLIGAVDFHHNNVEFFNGEEDIELDIE